MTRRAKARNKKSGRFGIRFHHNGIENVAMLLLIFAFFAILAPLSHTQLPSLEDAGPKNDLATGLALSNTMENNVTVSILIILTVIFLIPIELMLRNNQLFKSHASRKRK